MLQKIISIFFTGRSEDQSRAAAEHRGLLAATSGLVFSIDQDGVFRSHLGGNIKSQIMAEDLLGRKLRDLVAPKFILTVIECLTKVFVQAETSELLCEMTIASHPYSMEIRFAPSSPGNAIAVVQEAPENTQLKEQLRNSQKTEIIGRLALGLAHDFNNLLMIISGYCHLLSASLSEQSSSYSQVRAISRASERASSLTTQLLNFGHEEKRSPQVLDLNQVIHDTDKLLALLAGDRFRLQTSLAPDLNCVKADKSEIERVLMNLIINARDAMPQGGNIIIETNNIFLDQHFSNDEENVSPGNYVMLTVRDTGKGIKEENLPRIFEPFFTTKNHRRGTGLGLSTVVDIINQYEGHISVESQVGNGSTFKIYLPQAKLQCMAATPHMCKATS